MADKKDPRLARAGVSGYNKPKRTPSHPKKSHVVVAKEGDKVKTIRFGERSHVFRVFCDGLGGITQAFFHLFSHFFPTALADIFKFIIW